MEKYVFAYIFRKICPLSHVKQWQNEAILGTEST